ncbi:MAG: PKD domain-containing protein [Flavobacteriales bacterium]|nr:PKD domain-containing protein [Flavobacteriales bacterium]
MKKITALLVLLSIAFQFFATQHSISNLNDSGQGSLRDLVSNSSVGDTIHIPEQYANDTIQLTSGVIPINSELVILGPTTGHLTIDANLNSRIFSVTDKATIKNLHLTRGSTGRGGAIYATDSLYIEHCYLNKNVATGSGAIDGGGAIMVYGPTGYMYMNDCWVDSNSVPNTNNHGGGGICFSSNLNGNSSGLIENSSVTNNSTWLYGGGIYVYYSNVVINNVTISNNHTDQRGGGLAHNWKGSVHMNFCTVTENSAGSTSFSGGGLYCTSSNPHIYISNSIVENNIGNTGPDMFSNTSLISSLGNNSFGSLTNSGLTTLASDTLAIVGLKDLDFYGWHMPLHPFTCGSYAQDRGDTTNNGVTSDMLGQSRFNNGNPDIGAYESNAPNLSLPSSIDTCVQDSIWFGLNAPSDSVVWYDLSGNVLDSNNAIGSFVLNVNLTLVAEAWDASRCFATKDTLDMHVNPLPGVSVDIDTACLGNSTSFDNLNTSQSIYWDFDADGVIDDSLKSTSYTYGTAGTQTLIINVIDSNNCSNADTVSVLVYNSANANFSTTNLCVTDTVVIQDSSTLNSGTYSWDFNNDGTIDHTGLTGITFTYATAGSYDIKLILNDICGLDSMIQSIQVFDQNPSASFTIGNICVTDSLIAVNNSSTFGNPSWYWDFDGDGVTDQQIKNPMPFFYDSVGTYPVKLVVVDVCGVDSAVQNISILGPPQAQFTLQNICLNDTLQIVNSSTSQPNGSWQWDFESDNVVDDTTQHPSGHIYNTAASYTVQLIVSDICGADTAEQLLQVHDLPQASIIQSNDTLFLSNTNYNQIWYINNAIDSSEINYYIIPQQNGDFFAELTNSFGCMSYSDTLSVINVGISDLRDSEFYAYPNPTNGMVYFNKTFKRIDIYTMQGALVRTIKNANSADLGNLQKGTYILRTEQKVIQFIKR